MEVIDKWDLRFLHLAKFIGSWSKDPSRKVGAVVTKGKYIVSLGYNGFPKNVIDSEERYLDRNLKLNFVVHAETNAILSSSKYLEGCFLYVFPLFPCNECAKLIIQSGIKRVVSVTMKKDSESYWHKKILYSKMMFDEAKVEYKEYDIETIENTFVNFTNSITNYSKE